MFLYLPYLCKLLPDLERLELSQVQFLIFNVFEWRDKDCT